MALLDLIDRLQATVLSGGSISNTKGQFAFLRDQIEALEREHSELVKQKSDVDQELAKIKAQMAKTQADKRETFGFSDLGGVH